MSFDEALTQSSLASEPLLDATHLASIAFVVVSEEMQQPMQCQHSELGELGMTRPAGLAPRDTAGDHDVTEEAGIRD